MALDLLPFSDWAAGTLQNSVPANTNALRSEVLAAHVISDSVTAQPGTPADGDCYIIPTGRTGTQWATFAIGSLAYFRGGAWYEFTAYEGLLKVVGTGLKLYTSSAWTAYGGGGGGGFANPMTTLGDIIVGGTAGAATRLGVGAEGQVLKVVSGVPAYAAESGGGSTFGPGAASYVELRPVPNSGTWNVLGASSPTGTGNGSAPAIDTTNRATRLFRVRYTSPTATTTSICGVRMTDARFFLGSATTKGFDFRGGWMMAVNTSVSTHRVFYGLRNDAAPTDVNPSTLTNMLGFGYDSADTNVQFFHNDASGTATKVDTGLAKPSTDGSAAFFVRIFAPGGPTVNFEITNIISGATFSGTATTDLPAATQDLRMNHYASVGGTSSTIGCEYFTFGCRQDI